MEPTYSDVDLIAVIELTPQLSQELERGNPTVFNYLDEFHTERSGILFLHNDRWFACENCCLHMSLPLVMPSGEVAFSIEDDLLICHHHYARFSLSDGCAASDFCAGLVLRFFDVKVDDNLVYISQPKVDWIPKF